jgi:uncharacterized phage protein gp47/JayE
MPTLNTQTFGQIVRGYAAAVQSAATQAITFAVGSVELALAEAQASVAQWLQGLIVLLLSATRLSTSQGADADTFVGDFGLTRLPAVPSSGPVIFSRFTPTNSAFVAVGRTVQTPSGVSFVVIADTTQAAFSATLNGYTIPAGTASITATVQAVIAGTSGNVQASAITVITSPISGVDTVTNVAPFADGVNVESDRALKARFVVYIQGLRQAILTAIQAAIDDLQQGIQYTVTENENYNGAAQIGNFSVVCYPNDSVTVANVYAAVDAARGLTITFSVNGAGVMMHDVSVSVTAAAGYALSAVEASVTAAIQDFMSTQPLGAPLYYTQLYAVIYAVPGVQEATNLLLDGGTADIPTMPNQILQPGTVTVN